MLFNSTEFLTFFPIVVLGYYLIPHKFRYLWILFSSYFFYMCWNVIYGLLLFGTSLLTYLGGMAIEKTDGTKTRKGIVAGITVASLLLLSIFKYSDFIIRNIQSVFKVLHIRVNMPTFSIVLPVGISFYLFQSLGYVIDVYRGKVHAEKNFFRYAAFISFFPQLVAGPIERAANFLPQFYEKHKFEYQKVKENLLLMLWGMFLKIVVADRIAIYVDTVYNNYMEYGGWLLIIATILFAFQIYCDFAGYSTIAIGAAGVMGFRLMENFKSPYCAVGIRDFWSRWHISLTGWFRDYLYIPLGGNRKGKWRKCLNTMIVFACSGLWHGARWSFVIWGLLNGAFIVLEDITLNARVKVAKWLKIRRESFGDRLFKTIFTFILVDISWVFFRANGLKDVLLIFKQMFTVKNINVLFDDTIHFYIMEKHKFFGMLISILIMAIVDICHNHNIHFRERIERQSLWFRWLFYLGLIMTVLIFGVWGPSFDKTAFIYFQF